jgi:hypothetical protein
LPDVVHHFAILAPVPLEHLQSGALIAAETGYVAFGSAKWELFRQIDAEREGAPVPVLIYPSHDDTPATMNFVVSWWGWYVGHSESKGGAHVAGMAHRPPTTIKYEADNSGHWAVFWHVQGLRELPPDKRLPIGKIPKIKGGWRKTAPPRGPELVTLPETLSYES